MTVFAGGEYKIFQDPITREDFEGIAKINCVICEQDEYLCRCEVVFDGEDEPYERLVDGRDLM
jgi:hypothetical protein